MVDLFRWHGSEEVEHRIVAHDVAIYFHDSYLDRIRAMAMAVVGDLRVLPARHRGTWSRPTPNVDIGWWQMQRLRMRDSKLGLLPKYRKLFGVEHRRCTSGPASPPRRWVRRRRRSPISPAPPRPARRTFDGTARRYRQAPPSASGRRRHDLALGIADALGLGAVGASSGAIRRMTPPPRPRSHPRADGGRPPGGGARPGRGRADARRADGRPLPRWHPGAHIDVASAQRSGAAVLAVRRPGRHRTATGSRCAASRRRRRVDRGARRLAGRRGGHHQRSAQRVPAHGARLRLARPTAFRFIAGGIGITPILPMLGARRSVSAWTGRWSTPAAAATACRSSTR